MVGIFSRSPHSCARRMSRWQSAMNPSARRTAFRVAFFMKGVLFACSVKSLPQVDMINGTPGGVKASEHALIRDP